MGSLLKPNAMVSAGQRTTCPRGEFSAKDGNEAKRAMEDVMAKTKAQREAEERLRKNNERIYKQTGYDPDGWRERVAEIARTERNFAQPSRPKKQKDFTYLKNAARNAQDRVAGIDPYAWQNRDYGTKKATETGWRWDFQKPNDAEAVKSEAKQAIAEDKDLIVTKGQQAAAALTSGQDTPEIRAAIKAYEDLQEAARTGKAPEKDLGYTGTKAYVDNAKKGMSAEEVSRTIERGRTAGDFTPYLTAEGEEKNVVSVDGVRSEDVNDIYFLRGLGEDSKAENALYSYGNIKRAEDRNAAAKDAQARGYISSGELLSYSGYKPEKSADELRADRDAAREAMQKAEQRIGEVYHAGGTQAEITAARAAYAQAQKAYQQANYAYNAAYNLNEFTQNETAKAEYDKVRGNADFQKIVEAEKAKGNALPVSTSGIASMPFYSGYYAEEKLAAADPEVIDTAYYIRATQGEEAAKNYLELYDSELEQALADKWLNELYGMGEGLQQGAYKRGYDLSAGVNRFLTGFENLGAWGSEDIPLAERNAIERAQGTLAEGYTGGEKLASDVLYNFGNIAPSAALSFLPGGGQAAALAAMGASTLGGTYADTRRAGYGHEEARLYAAANAGAETMMQYALGGIAKLGAGSGLASKLSSAAQRVAANPAAAKGLAVLGNMGSEAAEEYLQANLDPVLRNAILNEENELDPISEDKWYAALLGAVSAAGMNAASDAAGISQTTNMGKAYNSPDVMQALVQQGLASGADTAANRQAQRLAGKLDAGKAVSNFEAGALAQEIAKAGGALSDPVAEQEVRIPTRREAGALDVTDAGNRIRYEQEIDGVFNGELPTHEEIIMGRTPELLTLYGAPDLPLHMTQATARKIAYPEGYQGGRHNLGIQALKELPEQLSDPVAILESKTQPDSHVVLTEWNDTNGDRVIVPIHFNKNGALKINTNEIVSAYGKGNISALMGKNNENVIYTRNNENIADLLAHGLQLPEPQVSSDFSTYNIPRSGNGVNRQYSAKMNADEMLDRIGTQRAYNPSETVKLANGTEAVVVARDGNSYVVQEPGKQGYSRVSADSITGKVQSASPQADRSIAPEARAALNEKYDHRHVEKLADQAFLDKLEQGRGIKAVIEDMQPGAEAFYDRSTNTIHFAPDSTRADVIGGVAAHELSHAAEASEHYKAYSDYAVQRLFGNDAEALRQAIEAKQEQYVRHGIYLSDADAMAEIVADYTRNLYKSPADIDALVTGNRGMAQSIYDAIRTAIQKIRAFFKGDEAALRNIREYQDLRRAQKLFERALSTIPEVQAEAAPAYSVNKSFAQQVDEVLSNPDGRNFETSHLMMGDTPQKLVDLGMNQLPMLVTSKHIWTIANEAGSDSNVNYHGLGADMVKQLPQAIDDPAIIMVSKTRPNDSVVLLTELIDRQGRPVLAAIRFNGHGNYNNVEIDANVMTSAYGRTGVNNFVKEALEENRILDVNKEKSQFLEKTPGVQFPDNLYKTSFEDNIARFRRLVNGETRQYSAGKMQKNNEDIQSLLSHGRQLPEASRDDVFVSDIIPQTDGDVNRQYGLREDGAPGDADVPPAQMEYIPKPMDADTPPARREYIPKPMDDAAPPETEQDRQASVLRNALAEGHEITPEEFKAASMIHKDAAAEFEAADKRLGLSEQEKKAGRQIAHGNYDLSKFNGPQSVLEWANAYQKRQNAESIMQKYRKDLRKNAREHAAEVIAMSDLWKDKKFGISYATETAYRNNLDVAGKHDAEGAERLQREYFDPIAENEAKATRYINELNHKIKELKLNKAESVLTQAYGEGLISDADLAEYAREPFKKIAIQNGDVLYQKEFGKAQKIDESKIKNAVTVFRGIYDELMELANDARVRNGYAPIAPRANYFPHFNEMTTKEKMLAAFGIDITGQDAIPEGIAGITEFFNPGTKWFANFQQREGKKTAFDAIEGFDGYVRGIKDVIFHTDDIQRLRALETALRSRHADETIKRKIDEINADPMRTAESKQADIQELLKNTQESNLSNYISWLHEYTNGIAGKKSTLDRAMEQLGNRKAYTVMRKLQGRVASNMIGYNVGSWLTNFMPLVQAHGQIKTVNMLKGIKDTIKNWAKSDGFVQNSDFLVNRRGTDALSKDALQKFSDAGVKPMEWIDNFVSEAIVRAKYAEEMKAGSTPEEAMRNANQTAANIMADRSYGQTPTLFNAKNPFVKTLTMFQLEVNNQYKNLFKDLPREAKGSGGKAVLTIALGLLKYCVGAWLYNELYEKLVGRRPAFDPIGLVQSAAKDYAAGDAVKATTNLVSDVAEQIPFIGGMVGGGRVPVSSAIPFGGSLTDIAENIGNVASGSDSAKDKLWKELLKPAWYIAPPGGGGAVKKAVEGAQAIARGGEYGVDKDGNRKLKFATDGEAGDILRALLFGRYATDGGKEYIENGFKGLSVPQTEAHTHLVENGVKPERAEKMLREISQISGDVNTAGETITGSEKRNRMEAIEDYGLTPEQKYGLYYDLFFGDELKVKMDEAVKQGIGKGALTDIYRVQAGSESEQGAAGKTIDNAADLRLKDVIDEQGLTEQRKEYLYDVFGVSSGVVSGRITQEDINHQIERQEALADAVSKETYTAFDEMEWDSENEAVEKREWILENCKSDDEIAAMYAYYMESKDTDERSTITYAQEQGVRPSAFVEREIQKAGEHGLPGEPEEDAIWEDGKIVVDEHGTTESGTKKAQACENLLNSGYTEEEKEFFYQKQYSTDDNFPYYAAAGLPVDDYLGVKGYTATLKADKDENGKSISGSKKQKLMDFLEGSDMSEEQKLFFFAQEYKLSGAEAQIVRDYINGLDTTDDVKEKLLASVKLGGSSGGSSGGRRRSSGGGSKAKQSVPDFSSMAAVIESRPKEVTYSGEPLNDVEPDAIWQAMFEAQRGGKTGNRFNFVEDFLSRTS